MTELKTTQSPAPDRNTVGNGLGNEMSLIPAWAYVIAGIGFIGFQILMHTVVARDPHPMPPIARTLIGFFGGVVVGIWIMLIGYVSRDSKRRGMNVALWTLLVIFVPNALGFILYFLIRKPLQVACGHCGAMLQPNFRFCPKCATPRFAVCGHCNTPTEPGDLFCNNCGRMLHEPMK